MQNGWAKFEDGDLKQLLKPYPADQGARKDSHGLIAEPGDMVVYVAGCPAIYGVLPLYFRDTELLRHAKLPSTPANHARRQSISWRKKFESSRAPPETS